MAEVATIQARGVIALPADIRKRHGLEPGTQVAVVERDDGVIELHPVAVIPASQAWFWTERWQKMEREVDRDVARGDVMSFDSGDEFFDYLEKLDAEP